MSAIMIPAIAEFAKLEQPEYLRLVQVMVYNERPKLLEPFRQEMKKAENTREWPIILSDDLPEYAHSHHGQSISSFWEWGGTSPYI